MSDHFESKDPFNVQPRMIGNIAQHGPAALTPTISLQYRDGDASLTESPAIYDPAKGNPIYSAAGSVEELQGVMNRNLPMPNFMRYAKDIHEMARPGSQRRALLVLGDPGLGKTANVMAATRVYGANEYVQCEPEMRASDLIRQLVFSPRQGGQTLEERADEVLARINAKTSRPDGTPHTLSAAGAEALSKLGSAFKTDDKDHYSVDWQSLKHSISNDQNEVKDKGKAQNIIHVLRDFLQAQGEPVEATQVDVKPVDGPFIRAVKQGKPVIVMDEFSRLRNYDALQGIMEVFTGQKETHTLKDQDDKDVVFRRGQVPLLLMTGNVRDSGVTLMQDNPIFSRLKTIELTMPENQSERRDVFRQAFEYQLTRSAPSLLQSRMLPNNPPAPDSKEAEALAQLLHRHVTFGLKEEERKLFPRLHTSMILNADRVTQASAKIANLCVNLEEVFNPENPAYAINNAAADETARYLREHPIRVDLRTVQKWVSDAIQSKSSVVNVNDLPEDFLFGGKPPASQQEVSVEQRFGTDLATAILQWRDEQILSRVNNKEAKETLRRMIDDQLSALGITFKPNDHVRDVTTLVGHKLNIPPNRRQPATEQASQVRDAIIREAGLDPSTVGEGYLPLGVVGGLIADMHIDALNKGQTGAILTVASNAVADPSEPVARVKMATTDKDRAVVAERVEIEALLKGLTLPVIGRKNFERLFPRDISQRIRRGERITNIESATLNENSFEVQMLENHHHSGIAVNALDCRTKDNQPAELQVWHNRTKDITLLVGPPISDELVKKLGSCRNADGEPAITYVNREAPGANNIIRAQLTEIFTPTITHVQRVQGVKVDQREVAFNKSEALKAMYIRRRPIFEHSNRPATLTEMEQFGTGRYALQDTELYDNTKLPSGEANKENLMRTASPVRWEQNQPCVMVERGVKIS